MSARLRYRPIAPPVDDARLPCMHIVQMDLLDELTALLLQAIPSARGHRSLL
jgi:hypothetical protein